MKEEHNSTEQAVRELLQESGKRPPLPTSDLAIIKAAARHEWEQVQQASESAGWRWDSRRLLALAAVLLVAVLAGWWWRHREGPQATAIVAVVEISSHPGAELAVGSEIAAGTRINTHSPMAIRLDGGRSLRLAADTSLKLVSSSRVRLDQGAVYVDSGPSVAAGGVRIRTDHGVVREVGTQFEVRIGPEDQPLRIRVREGEIIMSKGPSWDGDSDSHSASAGEELALQPDGSVLRMRVATSGDEWKWTEELAPPFILDESSFSAYLDWLARETGWQIEFEDEALRQSASEIVLYGSLEEASPSQSVEIAFPTSGLSYRLDGGRLEISRD